MKNNSGLRPLGRAVLVKLYEPPTKMVIALPDFVKEKSLLIEQQAVVVAVGPMCWPEEPARAQPGDRVLISKFAGYMARGTKDEEWYRIVNDNDIFAGVEND